jgi:hypothetical protein
VAVIVSVIGGFCAEAPPFIGGEGKIPPQWRSHFR